MFSHTDHACSESSSRIDGTTTKTPHSTPLHTHTHAHSTDKSQKAYQSITQSRIPIPMASLPHTTYLSTSSNTTHVPASLAYELSTRKVLKPEPVVRPRRRVSSFSRELSKRPLEVLEVLRKRSGQLYTKEQEVLEKIHAPKIINGETEENVTRESALKQSVKRGSYQMHLPTAEIEPPTDLPGVRPNYQPLSAEPVLGNPPIHHQYTVETRRSQVRFHGHPTSAMCMDDDNVNFIVPPTTTTIEDGGGFQPRVPSTILLQLNTDTDELYESHPLSGFGSRRSRHSTSGHIMHTPRHQLLAPKSTVVVCPFSEEASPNHELETRGLLLRQRESALQSRERKSRESYRQQSAALIECDHPPLLPSVSPDYMLVGAHFADNNLVLVDKDGKIVHQLTDTEGESDANIIAHLSDLNIHAQTSMDQEVLPHTDSVNLEEGQSALEASKPGTGVKAPPPTALEHSRDSVEDSSEQGLIHTIPEVEDKTHTEEESGDVLQETETEVQPIAIREENETEINVERESQDDTKETLLTVKSEDEQRQIQPDHNSEDGTEQTLHIPIAVHEEDKIPENKSVEEGIAEVTETKSKIITGRTDAELQVRWTSPKEQCTSDNENGSVGTDLAVEMPVSITEEQTEYKDINSEEYRVEGSAPRITHSDSPS